MTIVKERPAAGFEAARRAMIDNDFEWVAVNREAILAEWQKRYDSKSEPKS